MGEEALLNYGLTCHDLRFAYGSKVILDGIDLIVGESETLAIFGRSGAGKSTLLKVINLLETPSSGDGFLHGQKYMSAGRPLYALNEIRAQMPLVFQHFNLFPNLTALTNITLPARRVKNIPKAEAEETAYFLAEQLEIKDVLLRYPSELSGGQAQRVAIARSLALQPPVLLLDEVTSALDPETVLRLTKTIKHIRTLNVGKILSIVIVTHIINFAVDFADRIVFLHEGKFIEDEKASDFVTNVRHPAAREFVSTFSS